MTLKSAFCLRITSATACLFAAAFAVDTYSSEIEVDYSGQVRLENRLFYEDAANPVQASNAGGFVLEPEVYFDSGGNWSFQFAPFYRYDSADSSRSHADLREAYFLYFGELGDSEWEVRLGTDRVFWGVAESNNVVDIVNQTDLVEHPNGKVKMGQDMAHLTVSGDWGVAELFSLFGHKERTFPGPEGRLRSALVVDGDQTSYQPGSAQRKFDFASRYSQSVGLFDLGLSYFEGTSREPSLTSVGVDSDNRPVLLPYYTQIRQIGLDAQLTWEAWLLKFEAISRSGALNLIGDEEKYSAYVAGGEYAFYSVFGSDADVSILAELNYDDRGEYATNVYQDDLFVAARLALNDVDGTELIASVLQDNDYASKSLSVEFKRRITNELSVGLELVEILESDDADIVLYDTRNDSFIDLSLVYNF